MGTSGARPGGLLLSVAVIASSLATAAVATVRSAASAAPPPTAGYVATDLGITEAQASVPFLISPNGRYVVLEGSPNLKTQPTTELIDTTTMATTPLPPRPGSGTVATPNAIQPRSVNDQGVVAGWTYEAFSGVASPEQAAVLWTAGGVDDVGAALGAQGTSTEFTVLNDGSQGCTGLCGTGVAGWLASLNGGPFQATGCAAIPGAYFNDPVCFNFSGPEHTDAINSSGTMITNNLSPIPGPVAATYTQVIEWSGANLPTIPSGLTGYQVLGSTADPGSIRWLNDNGDLIVAHNGQTSTPDGVDLYTAATQGVQPIQGQGALGTQVTPAALNDDDTVVGTYNTGGGPTGFVWTPTGGMSNLIDDVGSFTNEPAGSTQLLGGAGIGNNGDIIAYGTPQQGCPSQVPNCLDAYLLVPSAAPRVAGVVPSSGPMTGHTNLSLTGFNFLGPAGSTETVTFCPLYAVTGSSDCQAGTNVAVQDDRDMTVTTPDMSGVFSGAPPNGTGVTPASLTVDIVVTNSSTGQSGRYSGDRFIFATVFVSNVSPPDGPVAPTPPATTNRQITVTGGGFEPNGVVDVATVDFCWSTATSRDTQSCTPPGGTALYGTNISVIDDSHLTVTTPDATADIPAGESSLTTDVVVVTTRAVSSPINPPDDNYTFAPVEVTSVSPRAGPIAGGTTVTITGRGFGNAGDADQVAFVPVGGGAPIPATGVTVFGDTTITAVTPDVSAEMASEATSPLSPLYGARTLFTQVQVTTVAGATNNPDDAGKFTFPLTVVQLGDSIAAGEGTLYGYTYSPSLERWYGGDPSATWEDPYQRCHDSWFSYGNLVASALAANFYNFGCTGATYLNGITSPEVDAPGAPPYRPAQFSGNPLYDAAAPDVVLATFGADDIQFVNIVTACIESVPGAAALRQLLSLVDLAIGTRPLGGPLQCVPSNPGNTVQQDFFNELPQLQTYYAQLVSAIEQRGADAFPSKVPKIVFTDYMDPFPPSGTCPDTFILTAAQVQFLNGLLGQLNTLITNAVHAIMATDPNVGFADISHALDFHTWCTLDPWDYGLTAKIPNDLSSLAPFHPTPEGQASMARIVAPVVESLLGSTSSGPSVTVASDGGTGTANGVVAQPGDQVTGTATGFTPSGSVDAELHSTPVDLGSFSADNNGTVNFSVVIPLGTPTGSHQLILTDQTTGAIGDAARDGPVAAPGAHLHARVAVSLHANRRCLRR